MSNFWLICVINNLEIEVSLSCATAHEVIKAIKRLNFWHFYVINYLQIEVSLSMIYFKYKNSLRCNQNNKCPNFITKTFLSCILVYEAIRTIKSQIFRFWRVINKFITGTFLSFNHVYEGIKTIKGKLSFKIETASGNLSPTKLQVAPEHLIRPRKPEKFLSPWF